MSNLSHPSRKTYWLTYVSLMVLLFVTLATAFLPLGVFHPIANLGIAFAKAVLVVLFFMHLRYRTQRTRLMLFGSLLLLSILVGLVLIDYLTRV
jgi:cytochrome c oxidase subunit 4